MTIEDAKIIGFGTVTLLLVFIGASVLHSYGARGVWVALARYVAVRITSSDVEDTAPIPAIPAIPDTSIYTSTSNDAPPSPFDRNITVDTWIEAMARAPGDDGKKYRFSSNQIHAAIGGDRNTVLAKVKAIRATEPPPQFMQPDGSIAPATYPVTGGR